MIMFAQFPTLPSGAIENWLLSGAAVLSIVLMGRKLLPRRNSQETDYVPRNEFGPFRASMESELHTVRDRLDARFLSLGEKIEQLRNDLLKDGERRADSLHRRINELEAGFARVDERTRNR